MDYLNLFKKKIIFNKNYFDTRTNLNLFIYLYKYVNTHTIICNWALKCYYHFFEQESYIIL